MLTLRSYQSRGVENLRASYLKGKRAPLFVLPTGGGKTAIFSHIAQSVESRGKRVVILVHRHELLMQASKSLSMLEVPHGLISPKFNQSNSAVQIASVQTLVRRTESIAAPDLIVIDEAHHATSKTYRAIIDSFPKAHILGVTATPCRTDGNGLGISSGGIFDDLIIGPQISDLIEQGYLVKPIVYAPPIGIDLTGVKKTLGDYDKQELGKRIDKPTITGSAVEHYKRLCGGAPAIAFCVSIRHAEHVASEFRAAGIRAASVDGKLNPQDRQLRLDGLNAGTIEVLTSADLIGEGVDIPRVSAAILLRPTHSLSLYLQQVGRALRPYPGKKSAFILDHVSNVLRHGFPDDDREWSLQGSGGSKRSMPEGPTVKILQCTKCYFVYEHGPEACPSCGDIQATKKAREIEQAEGELEELKREEIQRKKDRVKEERQAKSFEELLIIEKARGYKPGWARMKWEVFKKYRAKRRAA